MIGQMVIAIASPVAPKFLLIDQFLYRFSTFSEKNEENLSIRSLNLLQNASSNSVLCSSSFIRAAVSNAS